MISRRGQEFSLEDTAEQALEVHPEKRMDAERMLQGLKPRARDLPWLALCGRDDTSRDRGGYRAQRDESIESFCQERGPARGAGNAGNRDERTMPEKAEQQIRPALEQPIAASRSYSAYRWAGLVTIAVLFRLSSGGECQRLAFRNASGRSVCSRTRALDYLVRMV